VNKKKQKNFDNFWPVALQRTREAEQKFFGSFFQKRTSSFKVIPESHRRKPARAVW
jgi:hypothetical protein